MNTRTTSSRATIDESALQGLVLPGIEPESTGWLNLREVPAWAASLVVHLLILFILGSLTQVTLNDRNLDPITSSIEELDDNQELVFDATVVDQVGTESDTDRLSPSQEAATTAGDTPQEMQQKILNELKVDVDAPAQPEIFEPNENEFTEKIDSKGQTEHPGGVEGAIDRLTFEIAGSLKEQKTLVIWLFDESGSLTERRNAIADRFENVYKQLGILDVGSDKALKTAVVGFGEKIHFYTPEPVDDVKETVKLVRNIKPDESGKEYVFEAVSAVAKKWLHYRTRMRRNIMIMIVTDERGDDYDKLEEVIHYTSKYGMRCYCVGNAAVFGREKGYVTWTYEDGYQEDIEVDQGPETVMAERLDLPFWGTRSFDLRRMSASFGPYALTRLCAETKGMYLVASEGRGPNFDPAIMRNYQPDYRPIRDYQRQLVERPAKGALVKAATASNSRRLPRLTLAFRADTDTVLRQEVTEAQKPAALYDAGLQELMATLELGVKDRPNLTEPRWRASYDLAVGRVLAMRVRAFGYNVILAQMKSTPKTFEKPDNNTWQLIPAREVSGTPTVKKMAAAATEYLTRVIDEHPGTPWALLAERELSQPLGWDWQEISRDYSMSGGNGVDRTKMVLFEEDPKTGKKTKVVKNRTKPKL